MLVILKSGSSEFYSMDRDTNGITEALGTREIDARQRVSALVEFHTGEGRDAAGRRHEDVLKLDDDHLEWTYDWTQWTFPDRDGAGPRALVPTLNDDEVSLLRNSSLASERMARALFRMTSFLEGGTRWLREKDCSHARIARAIRSSRLILGDQAAIDFRRGVFEMMIRRSHRVGLEALTSWRQA
ncbi:hypothetical protein [Sphingomonas sp. 3-13AW]|uniref:hypothetical protein n=1 Tax=Sphingomonas sp. 3-13AW TaxID=3050450 RepID=UPI003BB4C88C